VVLQRHHLFTLFALHDTFKREFRQSRAELIILPLQHAKVRLDCGSAREDCGKPATELPQLRKPGAEGMPRLLKPSRCAMFLQGVRESILGVECCLERAKFEL
jgi:hypothetical protein